LLGIGHKLFDAALSQAMSFSACVCILPGLKNSLFIFLIIDRVTGINSNIRQAVTAVSIDFSKTAAILKDWELIKVLNELPELKKLPKFSNYFELSSIEICQLLVDAEQFLEKHLNDLALPFKIPAIQAISVLLPSG
jgi:hypothetical protein